MVEMELMLHSYYTTTCTTCTNSTKFECYGIRKLFDRVGQNIADALTEQKVANHRLREQLEANNETLQGQTDAMAALAHIT